MVGEFGGGGGGGDVAVGGDHVDQPVEGVDLVQGEAEAVALARVVGHRLGGIRRFVGGRRRVAFGAVGGKREVAQRQAHLLHQKFQADRDLLRIDRGWPFLLGVRRARLRDMREKLGVVAQFLQPALAVLRQKITPRVPIIRIER